MNNRLAIQEIAGILAEKTGKSKSECERFLRTFVSVVTEGMITDQLVKIKGVGTFKLVLVEPRESVDVNTGERFILPAHYKASFTPDTELKDLVNEPFSFFETTELSDSVDVNDLQTLEEEPEQDDPVETTEATEATEAAEMAEVVEEITIAPETGQTEVCTPSPIPPASVPRQKPVRQPDRSVQRSWGFAGWAVVFLLIVCGVLAYLYISSHYVVDVPVAPPPVIAEDPALLLEDEAADLIPEFLPEDSLAVKEEASSAFKEIALIRIQENDRLTYLAEKYYGNRVFWVYIYQFNRTVIRNPDVITVGMELIIPDPAVYGIDANDSTSIRRAIDLEREIKETKR